MGGRPIIACRGPPHAPVGRSLLLCVGISSEIAFAVEGFSNDVRNTLSKQMSARTKLSREEDRTIVEVALVKKAQGGDADAFGRLVEAYHRRAISLAYRFLGNSEDAKDVAQDAFLRVYRSLDRLEDPARFQPWLLRTVSNLALNFRRARAIRRTASLDGPEEMAAEVQDRPGVGQAGEAAGELSDAPASELHGALQEAMGRLPEQQRAALILFAIERIAQKEVAEILQCSVEMVKWNVFQARKKLKDLLVDYRSQ